MGRGGLAIAGKEYDRTTSQGGAVPGRVSRYGRLARMIRVYQRMAYAMKGLRVRRLRDDGRETGWVNGTVSFRDAIWEALLMAQCKHDVPQRIWNRHSAYLVCQLAEWERNSVGEVTGHSSTTD